MQGIRTVWSQINILIFINVGNLFYKKDSSYPWLFLAITYAVCTVIFIVLSLVGLIDTPAGKKKKTAYDDEDEEDLKESLAVTNDVSVDIVPD